MQNISDTAIFADSALAFPKSENRVGSFTLDTSLVLFFLAMEIARSPVRANLETGISVLTLAAFVVLPYLLPFTKEAGGFLRWITGRVLITISGVMFGLVFSQATGTLLSEAFRFVPMTLLIVAAIICCNIQIYGILKIRLAR